MTTTTDVEIGVVDSVWTRPLGATLKGDHPAGSTSLAVGDAAEFTDTGTALMTLPSGATETVTFTAVDYNADVLTLAAPTVNAAEGGASVLVLPTGLVKYASVYLELDGGIVTTRVPHALSAALLEGQRDDTNPGETVQVGVVNGERVIVDVLGKGPVYTGAVFQTGEAPEARMVIADDQVNASWIRTYSADEVTYSEIRGTSQWLQAQGNPIGTGVGIASLFLTGESAAGAADDSITATASDLFLEFDTAGNGHGVKFGAPSTGTPLRRLGFGDTGAQTTNASGQLVVTHGLGVAPVAVLWFDYAGNNPLVGRHLTGSLSSTTFTVAFRNSTTNAAAGSGVGVGGHWLALY